MTILVTGATGAVGRHLVAALAARGESVRALTRKPGQAELPARVEVVGGDLDDAATLGPAVFDGVDRVFVFPAGNGVDGLVSRAVAAGVRRFVVLSSLAAAAEHSRDVGSASNVHHLAVERAVTERTDDWTFLRPGTFASNLLSWAPAIRAGAPIRAPYLASAQAPIHEADVADAAAAVLTGAGHAGRAYPLTGPAALTRTGQVDTIATAIGRPIAVEEITEQQFRDEFGGWIPAEIVDMLLDYWRDTVDEPDRPRPADALTGRPARTLADWARDHRAEFAG